MDDREMGSDFNIDITNISEQNYNNFSEYELITSGRACLYYIARSLSDSDIVLLPSYICESMIHPFDYKKIIYYGITEQLKIDMNDLKNIVETNTVSIIIVINYFGIIDEKINELRCICDKNKITIVEDVTHSYLTTTETYGDIVIGSIRKTLPIPDGAIIKINDPTIRINRLTTNVTLRTIFIFMKIIGMLMKNMFRLKFIWRPILVYVEQLLNTEMTSEISTISRYIINKTDLKKIKRIRGDNYNRLQDRLKCISLYSDIQLHFGFPIILKNNGQRDIVREELIKNKIYPPIHWQVPKTVDEKYNESRKISNRIMTLPIDQRYDVQDMDRMAEIILRIIGEHGEYDITGNNYLS